MSDCELSTMDGVSSESDHGSPVIPLINQSLQQAEGRPARRKKLEVFDLEEVKCDLNSKLYCRFHCRCMATYFIHLQEL